MGTINKLLSKTGFSLSYYQGALEGGFRECERLEKALGVDNISFRLRFNQLHELIVRLKKLDDDVEDKT